jgi:hypothetical protein
VDLLVTILNYPNGKQKVTIEVENDRELDVDAIMQKIKKDYTYPTIVIIPKENEKDAWLFQKNLVMVWFWDFRFKWECRHCKEVFTTTSSRQPDKCALCGKAGMFVNTDVSPSDNPFLKADDNPHPTFREIQAKLHKGFFI